MRNEINKLIAIRKIFSEKNVEKLNSTWDSFTQILDKLESDPSINTHLIHGEFPSATKAYKSIQRGQGPKDSKKVAAERVRSRGLASQKVAGGLARRSDKSFVIHTNAAFHQLCSFVTQLIFALEPTYMASIKTVPATKPTTRQKSRAA